MKNITQIHKNERTIPKMKNNKNLQAYTYNLKLTDNDTIAFAFLAADRGLSPEQLMESFVRDIVSYYFYSPFYSDGLSEEEKHIADWLNGSWFSQDEDGYFSFLQYIIRNNFYKYVTSALTEIKMRNLEILKYKNVEANKRHKAKHMQAIKEIFNKYCTQNPAHQSFSDEIKIIRDFDNYINKITKGRINKWS